MIGPRGDLEHAILRALDFCGEVKITKNELGGNVSGVRVTVVADPYEASAKFSTAQLDRSFLGVEGMLARHIHHLVDDLEQR